MDVARNLALFGCIVALSTCSAQPPSSPPPPPPSAIPGSQEDTLNLANSGIFDLENVPVRELAQPVTTVTRQESTVGKTSAAVFVVTQEMIRRSGARNIPDILRLVPGLHVARLDGNKWSVSARGFSGRHARKLQVQIDGRSLYTPLFAGVYWDVADVLLDNIERIEVIRGPGSTVWGANAMNGVINIITKKAKDTRGVYVEGGGGTEERGFGGVRVGSSTSNGIDWRVSAKWFERDGQAGINAPATDDWRQGRVGMRADWRASDCDTLTVQGDLYTGTNGDAGNFPLLGPTQYEVPVDGGYALTRWTHTVGEGEEWSVQLYYDRRNRRMLTFEPMVNILDFDFQHRFLLGDSHNVIWGLGYQRVWDDIPTTATPAPLAVSPVSRTTDRVSAFIQDEITLLTDLLTFTIGSKISDNYYTDFEVQPSARLLYTPNERNAAWAAVSRSVRLPSRIEHDGRILIGAAGGQPVLMFGTPGLDAEELIAYELGYRQAPSEYFFWDIAIFHHQYQDGFTFTQNTPATLPPTFRVINGLNGYSNGVELSTTAKLMETWSLMTSYTFLNMHLGTPSNAAVAGSLSDEANPRNLLSMMSSWDIGCYWQFDLIGRYVDEIPSLNVPSYFTMDARLACQLFENVELSVVGQNLLDRSQPEYGTSIFTHEVATEVQRSVYGMVRVTY